MNEYLLAAGLVVALALGFIVGVLLTILLAPKRGSGWHVGVIDLRATYDWRKPDGPQWM